ncbi:MAG: Gfo/Idh/MocA family oxidoreductase [Verrucomicrobia bacterium]|nr:Gfo/Idh/MocA family oxidoreductase [Verrucomicrobiota bacterium]
MANSPLRIGIIGAGGNTRSRHIPGFQAIDGVDVVSVCNRSLESSQKVADKFGIAKVAADWREVIEDPEVDAVMIGTWPNMHAEATIAALRSGKHVLTEARMARNLKEAEEMLAVSRQYPELVSQLVPSPFSLNFDKTILRMIEEGFLGLLYEVVVEFSNGILADPAGPFSWRLDHETSGVNTLFSGIMHEALIRWVETDPEWVIADGLIGTMARKDAETGQHRTVLIPDNLSVMARFPQGFKATYLFSGVSSSVQRSEVRISGSNGSLWLDLSAGKLWFSATNSNKYEAVEIPENERDEWRVEEDFVRSIRDGKPVTLTNFETGVRYMRFSQAVWDSWTNGSKKVWL